MFGFIVGLPSKTNSNKNVHRNGHTINTVYNTLYNTLQNMSTDWSNRKKLSLSAERQKMNYYASLG